MLIHEKVKIKKKQRFEEVAMARYMCLMSNFDDDYALRDSHTDPTRQPRN